jgi:hypothetical protein
MVSTHSQRLVRIRSCSTDWRDCIIQVYVYLREAERRGFHDESIVCCGCSGIDRLRLWRLLRRWSAAVTVTAVVCILVADSTAFLPLKAVEARTALVDLDDGIALAVAEHIAAALVRTPPRQP